MRATKVRFRFAVDGAGLRNAEFMDEYSLDVGTHDAAHGVYQNARFFALGGVVQISGYGLEMKADQNVKLIT